MHHSILALTPLLLRLDFPWTELAMLLLGFCVSLTFCTVDYYTFLYDWKIE